MLIIKIYLYYDFGILVGMLWLHGLGMHMTMHVGYAEWLLMVAVLIVRFQEMIALSVSGINMFV